MLLCVKVRSPAWRLWDTFCKAVHPPLAVSPNSCISIECENSLCGFFRLMLSNRAAWLSFPLHRPKFGTLVLLLCLRKKGLGVCFWYVASETQACFVCFLCKWLHLLLWSYSHLCSQVTDRNYWWQRFFSPNNKPHPLLPLQEHSIQPLGSQVKKRYYKSGEGNC